MKVLFVALIMVVLIGCSSIINHGKSNKIKIESIAIPIAQCNMCIGNIDNALNEIDGIIKYKVEFKSYKVKVKYNAEQISIQNIEQLISKADYQANNIPADKDSYNKLAICCKLPKDRR